MPITPFWAQLIKSESTLFLFYAVTIPAFLLVVGYFLVMFGRRSGMRKAREEDAALRLARREAPEPTRITGPLWVFLLLVFAITFYMVGQKKDDGRQPGQVENSPNTGNWWIVPLTGAVIIGGIAFVYLRALDFPMRRAVKKFNAGDRDAAINDLERVIAGKGTANRLNVLACMLIGDKRYADAQKTLTEAQRLGFDPLVYQTNLAVILRGLGRPEEALSLIELHIRRPSASLAEVTTYCELLMDLKRTDAAREQLARAEAMFAAARNGKGPPDANGELRKQLDKTRDRLAAMVEKPSPFDDEL